MPEDNESEADGALMGADELSVLKARAKMMGITHSNNISIETLRAKINAKMDGEPDPAPENQGNSGNQEDPGEPQAQPNPLGSSESDADASTKVTRPISAKAARRKDMLSKQMRLVRIRVQNLDPKKKELPGEIFTIANETLGVVKKFVPYGEVTDEGYHVPFCIYNMLTKRRFVNITITKDRKTGREQVKTAMAKEFAIEVLPPLTPKELQELATAQRAAGGVD